MLTERRTKLDELRKLHDDCGSTGGRVVLATGAVGLGKTELLHAFSDRAAETDALVLNATGASAETSLCFGVATQLFTNPDLPPKAETDAAAYLDDVRFDSAPDDAQRTRLCAAQARIVHGLASILLGVAQQRPVVIVVDDVHFADAASIQVLLHLARRMRTANLLMVLAESQSHYQTDPVFYVELSRQPHYRRIQLDPISREGVAEILVAEFGERTGRGLTDAYLRTSGGNPLILRALIEDRHHEATAASGTDEPVTGQAFGRAVLACLHRTGEWAPEFARALAALGPWATPSRLGRLLGIRSGSAQLYLELLATTGLVEHGRFRHCATPEAVLDGSTPEDRAQLHLELARLLYDEDADPSAIADGLLVAGDATAPWAVPVLKSEAEHALAADDVDRAAACLDLARHGCTDPHDLDEIVIRQAMLKWRTNPAAVATRHLAPLDDAARDGRLSARHLAVLARFQLWHGHLAEAEATVARLATSEQPNRKAVLDLRVSQQCFPDSFDCAPLLESVDGSGPQTVLPLDERQRHWAAGALATMCDAAATDDVRGSAMRDAEQVLRTMRLDSSSAEPLVCSLMALVYADRPELGLDRCRSFADESARRGAATWHALFSAVLAEMHRRQGDLAAAEDHATTALHAIDPAGWGVVLGAPLTTLLLARTAMGKLDQAADALGTPVPEAMFRTRFGLRYLYARGRYYLAADCPRAALADFTTCGELARRWETDVPALLPWRGGAAEALLRLGRGGEARRLLDEQLGRAGTARMRGITLRLLTATTEPSRRPNVIGEAVETLRDSGDRFELALALTELSRTHHALGEHGRSRMASQQALSLARDCGAARTCARLLPDQDDRTSAAEPCRADGDGLSSLSDAERRVAELAALGHTNREIGHKLFITVSTVEQHLTRVYRKLNVSRRTELSVGTPERLTDTA
ncbi:regulatory protein, luxR family [Prauserella aidingensis]|uniref:helix-turn-helix transcriptional regulator n=1 Tax=Prauserella aidingensis TaxID=387890 RepID=UPI0020A25947|nr:LuxR family transcriptional regulator [Prauserella aidingensis]MCP2253998.1 regulatory protein, luxR family [Prauserella aidingensis]